MQVTQVSLQTAHVTAHERFFDALQVRLVEPLGIGHANGVQARYQLRQPTRSFDAQRIDGRLAAAGHAQRMLDTRRLHLALNEFDDLLDRPFALVRLVGVGLVVGRQDRADDVRVRVDDFSQRRGRLVGGAGGLLIQLDRFAPPPRGFPGGDA
jgi:hypothetical protein